jgi:hypothetical protein
MTKQQLLKQFALFLGDYISVAEFESWVYQSEGIEALLGGNKYLELISVPFKSEGAGKQIASLIFRYSRDIDINEFVRQRAIVILQLMLEGSMALTTGCRQMAQLYHETKEEIIPIEFVGYDSVPEPDKYHLWDKKALAKQLERVDWYKEGVMSLAKETLERLLSVGGAT